MNELVKFEKPQLPAKWEYNESVYFVKETVFKWKNLTEEIAQELWVAREMLRSQGRRSDLTSMQKSRSWTEYCEEIGSSKDTVNRWLKQWFETTHVSQNTGEYEWYTPSYIIEKAKNIMGSISLDPASNEIANQIINADHYYSKEDNGLDKTWEGNVWLNPPYSHPLIDSFSYKLLEELPNIKQACVLVNNATETDWLQSMIKKCNIVCFLNKRIRFIDQNGEETGSPLQGQVILYFGENRHKFKDEFSDIGICMKPLTGAL